MKKKYLKYKTNIIIILFSAVVAIGMFTISYEKIEITSIIPESISTLEANACMSIYGTGFKPNDTIYIDGEAQITTFGNEGWITCFIPQDINLDKDDISIRVKRESGTIDSNSNIKNIEINRVENE